MYADVAVAAGNPDEPSSLWTISFDFGGRVEACAITGWRRQFAEVEGSGHCVALLGIERVSACVHWRSSWVVGEKMAPHGQRRGGFSAAFDRQKSEVVADVRDVDFMHDDQPPGRALHLDRQRRQASG
jgi:hypothetical protein